MSARYTFNVRLVFGCVLLLAAVATFALLLQRLHVPRAAGRSALVLPLTMAPNSQAESDRIESSLLALIRTGMTRSQVTSTLGTSYYIAPKATFPGFAYPEVWIYPLYKTTWQSQGRIDAGEDWVVLDVAFDSEGHVTDKFIVRPRPPRVNR